MSNIVGLLVLCSFLFYLVLGYYQGLIKSSLGLAGMGVSLLGAGLFYGNLAAWVRAGGKVIPQLLYYSEGKDMLKDTMLIRRAVDTVTAGNYDKLMENVSLPHPIGALFRDNVLGRVFENQGITTMGDYIGMTIANVTVNILCFLAVYMVIRLVWSVAVHAWDAAKPLPFLAYVDGLAGAGVGALRCVVGLLLVFTLTPVVLTYVPAREIASIFDRFNGLPFYYKNNIIFRFIRGTIVR